MLRLALVLVLGSLFSIVETAAAAPSTSTDLTYADGLYYDGSGNAWDPSWGLWRDTDTWHVYDYMDSNAWHDPASGLFWIDGKWTRWPVRTAIVASNGCALALEYIRQYDWPHDEALRVVQHEAYPWCDLYARNPSGAECWFQNLPSVGTDPAVCTAVAYEKWRRAGRSFYPDWYRWW